MNKMSNKNDRADAEAICEAIQRPNMRFVGIKSVDQQAQQAIHRVRSRAVGNRTAHVNTIRGLLAEFGIEIPQGRSKVRTAVAEILGNGGTADIALPPRFLDVLAELYEELVHMDGRVEQYDRMIEEIAKADEQAQLLMTIPGIGPMTATALLSSMGDPGVFRNGRECASWLGLVPRQHSTGGKDRLLGTVAPWGCPDRDYTLWNGCRQFGACFVPEAQGWHVLPEFFRFRRR